MLKCHQCSAFSAKRSNVGFLTYLYYLLQDETDGWTQENQPFPADLE